MTPFNRSRMMDRAASAGLSYDEGLRQTMLRMYNYVASGLILSAIIAYMTAQSESALTFLYTTGFGKAVMFAPLLMLLGLALFGNIQRMSKGALQLFFWSFVALKGLSLAYVVVAYQADAILRAMFITAIVFGGLSLYGYTSKRDMTGFGSFLFAGMMIMLLGVLVHVGMSAFGSPSPVFALVLSTLTALLILGLTVYETWQFKQMYFQLSGQPELLDKMGILTALNLYINAVILFQYILSFMGNRD